MIRDELNAAGEAVRALARQRQAAGYLARLQVTVGTDQMPLPPSLEADLMERGPEHLLIRAGWMRAEVRNGGPLHDPVRVAEAVERLYNLLVPSVEAAR